MDESVGTEGPQRRILRVESNQGGTLAVTVGVEGDPGARLSGTVDRETAAAMPAGSSFELKPL